MIIHICGMPGVGKLAIAKHLKGIMQGRLIDNHALVDLVVTVCDRDKDYIPFLKEITALVFSKLAQRKKDSCIIFTNALAAELAEDVERFEAVRHLAAKMEFAFVPVLITCERDENARRIVSADRALKTKPQDPALLDELIDNYTIVHDPCHPNALTIDNTKLDAATAANVIVEHCTNLKLLKEPKS